MIDVSRARVGPEQREAALRKVPPAQFYSRLNRLKALNPAVLSEQQAFNRLSHAFHGYIMKSVIIGTNGVYRARLGKPDELFENVSQLWYPPEDLVTRRGRFNGVGESRFYCSTELHAAMYETRPGVGDRISLLIAGARDRSRDVELAHIGIHKAIVASEVVGEMGTGLRGNDEFISKLDRQGIRKRWLLLDDYLSDLATTLYDPAEEQDRYKLSLSAGRYVLRPPHYRGLLYPSVASDFHAFNICLYPDAADEIYFPSEVWVADVVGYDAAGDLEVQFVHRSDRITSSGNIEWSGRLQGIQPDEIVRGIGRSAHRLP